jgi:hypothetical protein
MNCKSCNSENLKSKRSKYCESCSELSKKESYKKYRENNKEKVNETSKKNYEKNKEKLKPVRKKWRDDNKEKQIEYNKERYEIVDKERLSNYYKENKEEINKKRSEYRKTDEYKKWKKEYDLKNSYKNRYRDSLKSVIRRLNLDKNDYTNKLLGYSDLDFKLHIESQFIGDMSWENKNTFEIDHIIPISAFIENTPLNIVSSLDNLKPMDPVENLKKFVSIDYNYINLYEKYIDFLIPKYKEEVINYLNVHI